MKCSQQSTNKVRATAIAFIMLALVFAGVVRPAQAQTFNVLYSFEGLNEGEGANPYGLVQGTDGFLYGVTGGGGQKDSLDGVFFKISTSGNLTNLCSFFYTGHCQAGGDPLAALSIASNGDFYGTDNGGQVWQLTPTGKLKVLYKADNPGHAPPIQASNGDLYGTNYGGLYANCGDSYCGSVFKLTTSGKETTLYSFCADEQNGVCIDGQYPSYSLVEGSDGNLYGTTSAGGNDGVNAGSGTMFKITLDGALTTIYNFPGDTPPSSALIEGADGNFYGTTLTGGTGQYGSGDEAGTFFKATTSGDVTYLYNFCSLPNCADGSQPQNIYLATDGNFYGITWFGGANGLGTIFQITPSGTLTTLLSFDGTNGNAQQWSNSIVQDTNGILYGTVGGGGAGYPNCPGTCGGVVFSLDMGLGPFVKTLPTSGKVNAKVKILGTDLIGATSVTFNGTAATFKVASGSEITTTVPEGATTGVVKVVTAGGTTLTSNTVFQVP
jgi:uncharacterized repeat protein (TIGR03803 family)